MSERIHVNPDAVEELRSGLQSAGEEYKTNLAKLTNLIAEITNGDIEGPMATDLRDKFEEKRSDFDSLTEAINKAEEAMGIKGQDYDKMLEDFKENAK